jgi:hypothetical protein
VVRAAGVALGCSDNVFDEILDFGDENATESGDAMEIEMETPMPPKIILEWYEKATPVMSLLQQNPKSVPVKRRLDDINNNIKEKNKEEEQNDTSIWLIDYTTISKFYQDVRPFIKRYKENPNNQEAIKGAQGLESDLNAFLDKYRYPRAWTFNDKFLMRKTMEEKKKRKEGPTAAGKASATEQQRESSSATSEAWRPGLTKKGEKIVGVLPKEVKNKLADDEDEETTAIDGFFLVEKKGERNPMVFEDVDTIGKEAAKAYLQLPGHRDIRTAKCQPSTADKRGFLRIKAIAVKPHYRTDTDKVYPHIAIWAEYEGDTFKATNRTVFRTIWGHEPADRMVEDFYIDRALKIPWKKRVNRHQEKRFDEETVWAPRSRQRSRSRTESPERWGSGSTSSSASYLSDEGLARLGGVEDRMAQFERMFQQLNILPKRR